MRKINNSFKIAMKKPNIRIVTFENIQIARHHIPRNLDAVSNVDSPVPNAALRGFSYLGLTFW